MASAAAADWICCDSATAWAASAWAAAAASTAVTSSAWAWAITCAASSMAATWAPTTSSVSGVKNPSPISVPPVSAMASKSGPAQ